MKTKLVATAPDHTHAFIFEVGEATVTVTDGWVGKNWPLVINQANNALLHEQIDEAQALLEKAGYTVTVSQID